MVSSLKIKASQISLEGLVFEDEVAAAELDLETETIKFPQPIKLRAEVSRITNAVTVNLALDALIYAECSRCLGQAKIDFKKNIMLNYPVDNMEQVIDLAPDIREEIILNYPIKPLCKDNCKGLCPKCGKSLNEGGCNCGST